MDFLNRIIDLSLRYRVAVLVGVAALAGLGVWSLQHLDVDAFPDTTPVQVQINTVAPALGPTALHLHCRCSDRPPDGIDLAEDADAGHAVRVGRLRLRGERAGKRREDHALDEPAAVDHGMAFPQLSRRLLRAPSPGFGSAV